MPSSTAATTMYRVHNCGNEYYVGEKGHGSIAIDVCNRQGLIHDIFLMASLYVVLL